MLALTSPTSGGRSVGIVRLRTKAPEFFFGYAAKKHRTGWRTGNAFHLYSRGARFESRPGHRLY
jgi:hypothetical protein